MLHTVGAFEAKTHFSALLERVEHGEEIFITRHGKVIARLLPIEKTNDNQKAVLAAKALRDLRKNIQGTSPTEWMQYRHEGRP